MKIAKFISPMLILLFLSSCSFINFGKQIIIESSCKPPCWNGITPGLTTEKEMLGILKKLPEGNKESLYHYGRSYGIFDDQYSINLFSYSPIFDPHSGEVEMNIYLKEGIVQEISFLRYVNFFEFLTSMGGINLSIGDFIELVGEPTLVDTMYNSGDFPGMNATIINSNIGYMVSILKTFRYGDLLTSASRIIGFSYFNPKLFDQITETGDKWKARYLWKGYGDIYQLYPPPDS